MKIITKTDFSKTLNLPKQTIAIKGNQVKKEEYILTKIQDEKKYIYNYNKNINNGGKKYRIEELPSYIESNLSSTIILNKVLKDFVVKSKLLQGDVVNHKLLFTNVSDMKQIDALPNSKNNLQELIKSRMQKRKELDTIFKGQVTEIDRLGTTINYETKNSTTIKKEFENYMFETFYMMYKEGRTKKELRPVHWCTKCGTSKRRKDLIFEKKQVDNYYILYRVEDDKGLFNKYNNLKNTYFIVSNVRPWIMVTSENIAVAKELEYSLVEIKQNNIVYHYIIASDYVDEVMQKEFVIKYYIKEVFSAERLKDILCMNPLDYRKKVSVVLTSQKYICYDTTSSTGVRTVSSGHTYIDYLILKDTKKEALKSIIDEYGRTNNLSIVYNNMDYSEVNMKIIEYLRDSKFIYSTQKAKIAVPKCDKCENETIYRCINEWYVLKPENSQITSDIVENLKEKILSSYKFKNEEFIQAINKINDIKETIISDKNIIGTPIPVFYCAECGSVVIKEKSIQVLKKLIDTKGSDAWYKLTPEDILQGQISCDCGCGFFFKENATLNNFFKYICINYIKDKEAIKERLTSNIYIESKKDFIENLNAISFMPDLEKRLNLFDRILIHSSVRQKSQIDIQNEEKALVNIENKKSKSNKNKKPNSSRNKIGTSNITVENDIKNVVNDYGTDVLRLWAASYSLNDKITLSRQAMVNINKKYKVIRRTFKYLLANLYDFNPNKDYIDCKDRNDIDKYLYIKVFNLQKEVVGLYNTLDFRTVYEKLINFCLEVLCGNYFEAIKYKLYILLSKDKIRRSTQSNLYDILRTLSKLLLPLIPFTVEEIWPYIWHRTTEEERNIYSDRVKLENIESENQEIVKKWDKIFSVKSKLDKKIQKAKIDKLIKNTLEAKIMVKTNDFTNKFIEDNIVDLVECTNVSSIESNVSEEHEVIIQKQPGERCVRCGHYTIEIGKELKYRYLCPECARILEEE